MNRGVDYPTQLRALLGSGFETRNYGRNAVTAIGGLSVSYNNTPNFQASIAFDADIYLLMLGTNDVKYWVQESHKFATGLEWIIQQVNATSPGTRIILAIPPWVKPNNFGIQNDVLVKNVQPIIRKVASAHQLELVDMFKVTFSRDDLYSSDNLHLNAKGYEVLAQTWQRQILCNQNGVCDIGESCETCRQDCLEQCAGKKREKEVRNDGSAYR